MGNSVNRVVLVGFLGRDPEIKMTTSGSKVANLSVATSESWKDKGGERQTKTEWHRVVVFNQGLAEIVEKYLHKGSKVYVEGSLQTRKWTDKDGKEQRTTEIVLTAFNGNITLIDGKKQDENSNADWDSYAKDEQESKQKELDDKIPF